MSTKIQYQFRIRTADDSADLFVASSNPSGTNPYIAEPPEGDGESLDPMSGKVEVGAYTIRIIDAPGITWAPVAPLVSEGWEYANQAAAEAAGWVFTDTMAGGTITTGATDQVQAGTYSLKMATTAGLGAGGLLRVAKTYDSGDGIAADTLYRVTVYARQDARAWYDVHSRMYVNGTERSIQTTDAFATLVVDVRSSAAGTLAVMLQREHAFLTETINVWWDALTIESLTDSVGTETNRIVTAVLADPTGRQQLLSKRAFIEERTDEGAGFGDWSVLTAGYITDVALTNALVYEFGVGSTQRIEQTNRVFDRCPDPARYPEVTSRHNGVANSGLYPTLDRASCIIGGPIIGDWGSYDDLGRPVFVVESLLGGQLVRLKWVEGFVHHHEENPPVSDDVRDIMNNAALEYLDSTAPIPYPGASAFQLASMPGLVCRTYDASTGAWLADHRPLATGPTVGMIRRALGDWFFVGGSVEFVVEWNGAVPAVGDRYRVAVFPTAASERNPFHVSGHPVNIAASVYKLLGQPYNDSSRVEVEATLGFTLRTHLRIKEHAPASEWLENTLFSPFGFASRLNDDGEHEFFLTRQVGPETVGTITIDDLHTDDGEIWTLEEQSAANLVVWESKSFLVNDAPTTYDLSMPIDGVQEASVTIEVEPSDAQHSANAVFGDHEIRFELPGEIEGYSTGTPDNPGPLDHFVAAIANPLFDWQGRGAIRGEFHALRGSPAYDAKIGDTLVLDVPHYPSALPGAVPVSQRDLGPRLAFVLQRTRTPEGATISFEDRGPAEDPGIVPEFTLAPDATFPHTVVEVTVTNEAALEGYRVRVEMLAATIEPSSGQFVRMWSPDAGDNPFDLPPVCAGSIVWVRMRAESGDGQVGAWSAFQSEDLPDLTPPSAITTATHGTRVEVSWTNGETDLPVEVLFRLTAEDTYTTAAILPAGSTMYTLNLPSDSAEYVVAVRYRAGPSSCVSTMATVDVITDVHLDLSAPINPAAWADGRGTFGMEVDGTAFPSGTEFWVASETAVGTGLAGTYTLGGELRTTPERMRFTNPFVAANDGMLRFLKARHRRGANYSPYCAEVSINPWLEVEPPPSPDPAPDTAAVTTVPVELALLVLPGNRVFYEVPEAATALDAFGGSQDHFPLTRFRSARVVAVVGEGTVPETVYFAVQAEAPVDSDNWVYLNGEESGPIIAVGPTAVGADTGKARYGEWVAIDDVLQADVRLRAVVVGGDEDAAKYLASPRVVLQLIAEDDGVPPEVEAEPPIEYPGSCTIPSPVDMDTGWSETGGGAGNVWSNQSDTTADLTLDGSETGANYWSKTLTVEPDQQHTLYIDVETDLPGVRPFLQIVGGDTTEMEDDGVETLKAQIEECDGTIEVRWGVQASDGAPASSGSDDLSYASQGLAEAAGWVFAGGGFNFGVTYSLGGYSTVLRFNGSGVATMTKTFTVVSGQTYTVRLWADGPTAPWFANAGILLTSGANTASDGFGGGSAATEFSATITASGTSLTVRIQADRWFGAVFNFAGLEIDGLGGGTEVLFRDLRYCLGSGVGIVDPDAPDGSEELPDPIPPGDYPPPPVGGARPFGIFNISSGGYGYWNSTINALNPQNCEDVLNLSRTNECMNMWKFGGERDWQVGGRFSYTAWKAAVDAIANNSRCMTALEAAISGGTPRPAWGHFVIDEPFHPRWGGTIGMATLDAMCDYSKSLFPTWPTILRVAPNDHRLTRAVSNCDIYWGEYKLSSGDPARYRDSCVEAAAAMGKQLILGIHYGSFPRPASGIVITPAQLEHYGGILVEAPSDIVLAFSGWRWTAAMYAQAGMPQAVGRLRDKFASRD
jgi:hypothetical protein